MGKKKFIDKKKSATFQLISRDTSDPNYNEGPSGDRVFVRVDENPYSIDSFDEFNENVNDSDSIFADAPDDYDVDEKGYGEGGGGVSRRRSGMDLMPNGVPALLDNVRKEILELGFPDDGYNYLAHLREIKNSGGGSAYYQNPKAKLDQLPNDVKAYDASRIEISKTNDDLYEKSIYNVASKTVGVRIQKVFDPEVAALLDESDSRFGSDVEDLDEDFVVNANLAIEPADAEFNKKLCLVEEPEAKRVEQFVSKSSFSQENVARLFSGEPKNLAQDIVSDRIDGKPRVRRLLDEQFDLLEHREYGTVSEDEYDNFIDEEDEYHIPLAEKLNHTLKEHVMDDLELEEAYKAPSDLLHYVKGVENTEPEECAADVIQKCMEYAEKYENENTDDEVVVVEESSDESEIWDCETIVSTFSNLDNHPGKIGAPEVRRKKKLAETLVGALSAPINIISLKGKQNLPVEFLPHSRKTATENLKKESNLKAEPLNRKQIGQESKEEKKERKAAIKEEWREARQAKKEMKGLYKCEAKHAQKVAAFTGPSSIHLM